VKVRKNNFKYGENFKVISDRLKAIIKTE